MSVGIENDVLTRIREQAAQRFRQLGWPTVRSEEWRYTNLAQLEKRVAGGKLALRTSPLEVSRAGFAGSLRGLALAELVFVDGIYDAEASNLGSVDGLEVRTFSDAPADLLEKYFARYADYERHPLTAWNTASAGDGAVIEVNRPVEGFIHLVFLGTDAFQSHPRNLIVAHRGAQITVVESYAGAGNYLTNAVTELIAEDGSVVEHVKAVCDSKDAVHIGTVQIHGGRAATVRSSTVTLGGGVVRNEIHAALAEEGANLVLDGLFVVDGKRHVDNHTVIDHAKPHCESMELFKGILDDEGRGIFDGTIIVRAGAQKTVARQTNRNLLLSRTAVVDSKPTLEISNDDVKCNHGSTIGQLDEEAMFYLRSRGIGEEEGRGLLIHAFASEIVDRIGVPAVREQIRRALFESMPARLPERRLADRTALQQETPRA